VEVKEMHKREMLKVKGKAIIREMEWNPKCTNTKKIFPIISHREVKRSQWNSNS
jgi:hypothetical protein